MTLLCIACTATALEQPEARGEDGLGVKHTGLGETERPFQLGCGEHAPVLPLATTSSPIVSRGRTAEL